MPSLKNLKQRIKSVKSTKKITGAMKMVATSHLRRFQGQLIPFRNYAKKAEEALSAGFSELALDDQIPQLLQSNRPIKTHLVVIVSSDRGLCGNFNMQIIQRGLQQVAALKKLGQNVEVLCLGKKAYALLSLLKGIHLRPLMTTDFKHVAAFTGDLSKTLIHEFETFKIDACSVVYSHFYSALLSEPKTLPLMPKKVEPQKREGLPLFGVDPGPADFTAYAAHFYVFSQLLLAVLESKTSEEATRMMAMDNATRNASEMIEKLEIVYNRTRQAYITKELIEIISGAEAL